MACSGAEGIGISSGLIVMRETVKFYAVACIDVSERPDWTQPQRAQ